MCPCKRLECEGVHGQTAQGSLLSWPLSSSIPFTSTWRAFGGSWGHGAPLAMRASSGQPKPWSLLGCAKKQGIPAAMCHSLHVCVRACLQRSVMS